MQPPIRLQPLPSHPAAGTVPKITPGSRSKTSPLETEAPFPIGVNVIPSRNIFLFLIRVLDYHIFKMLDLINLLNDICIVHLLSTYYDVLFNYLIQMGRPIISMLVSKKSKELM